MTCPKVTSLDRNLRTPWLQIKILNGAGLSIVARLSDTHKRSLTTETLNSPPVQIRKF